MFRYCLPLIPATVCSWIINISDRYFISFLIGPDVSGLYAVGNKVASILLILSGIFTSAWQLSIVSERSKAEQERFFSNVFSVYEAGALVGASLLMAASRLVMRFLAAPDYFSAWHYAPVLILGTAMACLGSFFASVYVAEKRSSATLVTTLAGAGVNLAGNALLIPLYGAMGAAVATLLSYLVILIARAVHSRSLLRVAWKVPRFVLAMGSSCSSACWWSGKTRPCPGLLPGDPGALLPPPVAGLEDGDLHPAVERWHVKNPTEASQSGSPVGFLSLLSPGPSGAGAAGPGAVWAAWRRTRSRSTGPARNSVTCHWSPQAGPGRPGRWGWPRRRRPARPPRWWTGRCRSPGRP